MVICIQSLDNYLLKSFHHVMIEWFNFSCLTFRTYTLNITSFLRGKICKDFLPFLGYFSLCCLILSPFIKLTLKWIKHHHVLKTWNSEAGRDNNSKYMHFEGFFKWTTIKDDVIPIIDHGLHEIETLLSKEWHWSIFSG